MTAELACSRDAFTATETERYGQLMATWTSAITAREELANGLQFTLRDSGALTATLDEFMAFERRCCPFLSFDIQPAPPGHLTFRMTGPPGTREFLLSQ